MVEPTKPPMEEHQPQESVDQDDADDTLDQQGWWDNANVSRLINPEAFHHFHYSCNQLLKNSNSDGDDNEAFSRVLGTGTERSLDEQSKLKQSPSMKG